MARVTWTLQGLDDLESVCLFIARDSPRYAELFAQRVFQTVDQLGEFPRMGRMVPEIGEDSIREVIVQGYRVVYVLSAGDVVLLTIHHGARPLFDDDATESV